MGFFSFFKKIGNGLKKIAAKVGAGIKTAAISTYNHVLKPGFEKVIKPFYNKIIKPIGEKAISFVSHGIDRVDRLADAGTNVATGIGDLFKSPILLYGALGIGALVLVNMTKK